MRYLSFGVDCECDWGRTVAKLGTIPVLGVDQIVDIEGSLAAGCCDLFRIGQTCRDYLIVIGKRPLKKNQISRNDAKTQRFAMCFLFKTYMLHISTRVTCHSLPRLSGSSRCYGLFSVRSFLGSSVLRFFDSSVLQFLGSSVLQFLGSSSIATAAFGHRKRSLKSVNRRHYRDDHQRGFGFGCATYKC